jgi:hypothetical protein
MKIRILACARSGTLYTTKVLQSIGLKVGHEWTDRDGTVSAFAIGSPPYPLMKWEKPEGRVAHQGENCETEQWTATLHQVRDPLKVIASCYVVVPASAWLFYNRLLKLGTRGGKLYRCMLYWLRFNELIEANSNYTYRVEEFAVQWPVLLEEMNLPVLTELPDVSTKTNHEKRNQIPFADKNFKVTWEDLENVDALLTKKVKEKAVAYGYRY